MRALADQVEKDAEQAEPTLQGDALAHLAELWKPDASRLTFERALRRGMGLAAEDYAAIVDNVWASGRPRQFAALGRAIAQAPVVGSRNVVGSRE